jgi:alkylation response protein AidB-like acyl-CoA dehydrogenase
VNGGWKVLTDALANERGLVGGGIVLKVAHGFDLLCKAVRHLPALRDDPLVRERIATLAAEIEVGRRLMIHCAELATSGTTPPEMGAISKVFSGELMERYGEAALELLGRALRCRKTRRARCSMAASTATAALVDVGDQHRYQRDPAQPDRAARVGTASLRACSVRLRSNRHRRTRVSTDRSAER